MSGFLEAACGLAEMCDVQIRDGEATDNLLAAVRPLGPTAESQGAACVCMVSGLFELGKVIRSRRPGMGSVYRVMSGI